MEYVINRLSQGGFVIALSINPGLIMGSRVDTLGDNQNAVR